MISLKVSLYHASVEMNTIHHFSQHIQVILANQEILFETPLKQVRNIVGRLVPDNNSQGMVIIQALPIHILCKYSIHIYDNVALDLVVNNMHKLYHYAIEVDHNIV